MQTKIDNCWRGFHITACGEHAGYKLKNGMITNSLAPFYLRWYRDSIPLTEMKKVNELMKYYAIKNKENIVTARQ